MAIRAVPPTSEPSISPTNTPTVIPSNIPSAQPTFVPSQEPSVTCFNKVRGKFKVNKLKGHKKCFAWRHNCDNAKVRRNCAKTCELCGDKGPEDPDISDKCVNKARGKFKVDGLDGKQGCFAWKDNCDNPTVIENCAKACGICL